MIVAISSGLMLGQPHRRTLLFQALQKAFTAPIAGVAVYFCAGPDKTVDSSSTAEEKAAQEAAIKELTGTVNAMLPQLKKCHHVSVNAMLQAKTDAISLKGKQPSGRPAPVVVTVRAPGEHQRLEKQLKKSGLSVHCLAFNSAAFGNFTRELASFVSQGVEVK